MKIALTAHSNQGLEAKVDSRFGRAPYFAFIDTETMEAEFIENPAVGTASGAGVLAAQTIADQKIDGLITGNVGPKAFSGINAAGIKIYSFNNGTLKEAVEALQKGKLKEVNNPTNSSHAGLR